MVYAGRGHMGHHLEAFIGRRDVLRRLAPHVTGLRLIALPQELALAPIPKALRVHDPDWEPGGPPGTYEITAALTEIAAGASQGGLLGWIETDWFGGNGESRAVMWRDGALAPIDGVNPLLRALGVVRAPEPHTERGLLGRMIDRLEPPRLLDEWDSVGLGAWRDTEIGYARAVPV